MLTPAGSPSDYLAIASPISTTAGQVYELQAEVSAASLIYIVSSLTMLSSISAHIITQRSPARRQIAAKATIRVYAPDSGGRNFILFGSIYSPVQLFPENTHPQPHLALRIPALHYRTLTLLSTTVLSLSLL